MPKHARIKAVGKAPRLDYHGYGGQCPDAKSRPNENHTQTKRQRQTQTRNQNHLHHSCAKSILLATSARALEASVDTPVDGV
jgi:hypothetical protein